MEKDLGNRLRRAVKENNLFHVKRLIQRIDMRNPDPGPSRFTSLAWAAVKGHEETFEYLLTCGHDDEELSKDGERNTILILLAGLGGSGPSATPGRSVSADADLRDAALRMARQYYDRYPYILDWSNVQGMTALHVAAQKGNEELLRMLCDLGADFDMPDAIGNTPLHYASAWGNSQIIQLLIERGCQYAVRNMLGFTASDYAYSSSTWEHLQETARAQFENRRNARRNVFAQAAARGNEWRKSGLGDSLSFLPSDFQTDVNNRLRSGSGGSRTTMTSDDDPSLPGPSSFASSISSQQSLTRLHNGPSKSPSLSAISNNYSATLPNRGGTTKPTTQQNYSTLSPAAAQRHPALSPVASRMREKDADAIAEYKARSRSGSGGSTVAPILFSAPSADPADRRLRPSMSAASLRNPTLAPIASGTVMQSPPIQTTALPPIASGPEKSVPRKLISSRALGRSRPGTAPTAAEPPPFPAAAPTIVNGIVRKLLLPSRHATHDGQVDGG